LDLPTFPTRRSSDLGWTKVEVVSFETGARDKIKGILLSNSCDIAPQNRRDFPPRIVLAPLIPLQAFTDLLKSSPSLRREQIDNRSEEHTSELQSLRH